MAKLKFTKSRSQKVLTTNQKLAVLLLVLAIFAIINRDNLVNLVESSRSLDFNALMSMASYDGGRFVFITVLTLGLLLLATFLGAYRLMVEGAIKKLKSNPSYFRKLEQVCRHELKVPVLRPNAWRGLSESLDCMIVKVPDRRRAVWKLDDADEKNLTLSASLLYTPEPIGRRRSQIYPRSLHVKAHVEGFGVSSKLFLTYSVDSPMDLVAVNEIIQKTNENVVSHMMAAEADPARLPEFADMNNQLIAVDSKDPAQVLGYKFSNQVVKL